MQLRLRETGREGGGRRCSVAAVPRRAHRGRPVPTHVVTGARAGVIHTVAFPTYSYAQIVYFILFINSLMLYFTSDFIILLYI